VEQLPQGTERNGERYIRQAHQPCQETSNGGRGTGPLQAHGDLFPLDNPRAADGDHEVEKKTKRPNRSG